MDAFLMVAKGGYSLSDVLAVATQNGLRNRLGRLLSMKSFYAMLENPVYISMRYDVEDHPTVRGVWEPLIPRDVFDAVQVVMKRHHRPSSKIRNDDSWRYPLRRFLRCSKCGKITSSLAKGNYPYYHCQPQNNCNSMRIAPSSLHALFLFYLGGLTFKLGRLHLVLAATLQLQEEKRNVYAKQIRGAKQKRTRLKAHQSEAEYKLIHDDRIPNDICLRDIDRINAELEEVETLLTRLQRKLDHESTTLEVVKKFYRNLAELWVLSDLQQRRQIQEALFPGEDALIFSMDSGFEIPPGNQLFSNKLSHSFDSSEPSVNSKKYAEFLQELNAPSTSWEDTSDLYDKAK